MVMGVESFRQWFAEYTEQYTIIGGTACDLLMSEMVWIFEQHGTLIWF